MAVTAFRIETVYDDDIRLFRWAIANGETPDSVVVAGFPDVTVQVVSITGSPTIIFEGTLLPADISGLPTPVYAPCEDPGGTAISFTAAGWETNKQAPYAIRPRITAGTGVTAVCVVLATRSRR